MLEAVCAKVGADKVGIRISPYSTFLHKALDDDAKELTLYLIQEMAKVKMLYLHCIEPRCVPCFPQSLRRCSIPH